MRNQLPDKTLYSSRRPATSCAKAVAVNFAFAAASAFCTVSTSAINVAASAFRRSHAVFNSMSRATGMALFITAALCIARESVARVSGRRSPHAATKGANAASSASSASLQASISVLISPSTSGVITPGAQPRHGCSAIGMTCGSSVATFSSCNFAASQSPRSLSDGLSNRTGIISRPTFSKCRRAFSRIPNSV